MVTAQKLVLIASLALALTPHGVAAEVFSAGPVDGVIDVTLAYGLVARTQARDPDFIGIGNGGNAFSVNGDDGDLNYDKGLVSNEIRVSADLTLSWRNFGFFIRGFGFYDFETQKNDRERTPLSHNARDLVGSGGELREYYLSAQFQPWGLPVMLRVGDQVINWGEGSFLRFGTDIINPLDEVSLLQPTASPRDIFVPEGMIWAAVNVTENLAVEAFYQYDWSPVIQPPVGWFFSADDFFGGDGTNFYVTGDGQFSDLGTNLSSVGGPAVFDDGFMRVPARGTEKAREQGQYGFTLELLFPSLNSTSLGVHFVNYHSRLPLLSGVTANQAAIDAATAIAATPPVNEILGLGTLSDQTSYEVTYPEDIKMLGLSFDTVVPRTGTLVGAELSHHFNWPVQVDVDEVMNAALSPITDALGSTSVGKYGASQRISGIDKTHKTQLSGGAAQAFGPTLWAEETLLGFNIGWVHFDGLAKDSLFDENSWGYSIFATVAYTGLFGGLSMEPFVFFTHDVSGITPGPAGAFLEDRKSIAGGVDFNFTNRITTNLTYVAFFDGEPLNVGADRDFFSFNIRYYY